MREGGKKEREGEKNPQVFYSESRENGEGGFLIEMGLCCFLVGVVGVGGAWQYFCLRNMPAQFAVYKSPKPGLNLSGS